MGQTSNSNLLDFEAARQKAISDLAKQGINVTWNEDSQTLTDLFGNTYDTLPDGFGGLQYVTVDNSGPWILYKNLNGDNLYLDHTTGLYRTLKNKPNEYSFARSLDKVAGKIADGIGYVFNLVPKAAAYVMAHPLMVGSPSITGASANLGVIPENTKQQDETQIEAERAIGKGMSVLSANLWLESLYQGIVNLKWVSPWHDENVGFTGQSGFGRLFGLGLDLVTARYAGKYSPKLVSKVYDAGQGALTGYTAQSLDYAPAYGFWDTTRMGMEANTRARSMGMSPSEFRTNLANAYIENAIRNQEPTYFLNNERLLTTGTNNLSFNSINGWPEDYKGPETPTWTTTTTSQIPNTPTEIPGIKLLPLPKKLYAIVDGKPIYDLSELDNYKYLDLIDAEPEITYNASLFFGESLPNFKGYMLGDAGEMNYTETDLVLDPFTQKYIKPPEMNAPDAEWDKLGEMVYWNLTHPKYSRDLRLKHGGLQAFMGINSGEIAHSHFFNPNFTYKDGYDVATTQQITIGGAYTPRAFRLRPETASKLPTFINYNEDNNAWSLPYNIGSREGVDSRLITNNKFVKAHEDAHSATEYNLEDIERLVMDDIDDDMERYMDRHGIPKIHSSDFKSVPFVYHSGMQEFYRRLQELCDAAGIRDYNTIVSPSLIYKLYNALAIYEKNHKVAFPRADDWGEFIDNAIEPFTDIQANGKPGIAIYVKNPDGTVSWRWHPQFLLNYRYNAYKKGGRLIKKSK